MTYAVPALIQGEVGRRRRSPFAESTNCGSVKILFVPPLVSPLCKLKRQEFVKLAGVIAADPIPSELSDEMIVFVDVGLF